jgi:hypothetical protein
MANIIVRPETSIQLPDTNTHVNRFLIKSGNSDRMYTIAQSKTGRWWSCGCHGFIRWKHCKHLESIGLPCNHVPFEAKLKDGK